MSAEHKPDLHLEIAHVLFMDVVGFSKLLINDQSEILEQLNQLVRETPHFREAEAAGKLIRLSTGDGMALVFSNSPEAPVECALEISETLKRYPEIQLRMRVQQVFPFFEIPNSAVRFVVIALAAGFVLVRSIDSPLSRPRWLE